MAKLTRKTNKVFGSTATATGDNPQIGQMGSALAGSYTGTNDLDTIQALPAWGTGWAGAVVSEAQFPALPEMTGAMHVFSYQNGYLLQEGIPEYDSGTSYYTNSIVKQSGTFKIYGSLVDDNLGNALTDTSKWKLLVDLNDASANQSLSNLNATGEARFTAKQNTITGGASTITSSNLTASRALISNSSGKVAVSDITSTELNYLDNVTSNIQTQLNSKQAQATYDSVHERLVL